MTRPRVAILGGGMAGLATAWELSQGEWRDRFDTITVYQRGWRLGGKGASSRGINDRIEEHGLHVLLGYYHETFRMMEAVYDELDRPTTDPDCPILTWDDAVFPSSEVGLAELIDGEYVPWTMTFPTSPGRPGRSPAAPPSLADWLTRSLQLLLHFSGSRDTDEGDVPGALRSLGLTAAAGAVESVAVLGRALGSTALGSGLRRLQQALDFGLADTPQGRRTRQLVDLVLTNLRGVIADGLLRRPEGFAAIDHLDYREWLRRHGAAPATVDSAIVRGMYNLVFAYESGDERRPGFSAGLGLELANQMLFGYEGAVFWKMAAGMGETIFAPLYQVLRRRGVTVEFFHRVDDLHVAGDRIGAITLGRQCRVLPEYEALVTRGGLPVWPAAPTAHQIVDPGPHLAHSETFTGPRRDVETIRLEDGKDFDEVVFAISLGMVPHVAKELLVHNERWQSMVDHVATVGTRAAQLWMTESEAELGWPGPSGVTLTAFAPPFDTWASMPHLVAHEQWQEPPATVAYLCSALPPDRRDVREATVEHLEHRAGVLWPGAIDAAGGFRWEVLAAPAGVAGRDRLEHQYLRVNDDPSDRYVQSLPGTGRYRLQPGNTGFSNLAVAGDWTDCGLNAGCVEAATRSGLLAARAVRARGQRSGCE